MTTEKRINRGEVYYANMGHGHGSEQGGYRPVVVIQNDIGNKYSPTTIVASLTTKIKRPLPTHIDVDAVDCGLPYDSTVLLEQVKTIDKRRLGDKITKFNNNILNKIDKALLLSIGLGDLQTA